MTGICDKLVMFALHLIHLVMCGWFLKERKILLPQLGQIPLAICHLYIGAEELRYLIIEEILFKKLTVLVSF